MHIKEIIIEGFKSYAVKTSIQGLDRHFNAITGLNGSGKSNIFDAICFVLGITSLSNVRASNLQELIYQKGNGSVTKASVTVIFNNTDKKSSPVGCEEYDEITVSRIIYQGKSKSYLNGYTITQENLKSMFQSVQLNINNPHFLIMQGKIRQVVNMKPVEILGLLEEAAGTSIYEMKKESSLKMIKNKEKKLEEITKLLSEEISPQLEKLLKDKQNYLTWKSNENEINRSMKILTAYDYHTHLANVTVKKNELVQYQSQQEEMQREVNGFFTEINGVDQKIKAIESLFKNKIDEHLKELEKQYKESLVQIKSDQHNKTQIEKNMTNGKKEIAKNTQRIKEQQVQIDTFSKDKKDLVSNLEMFEKDQQNQREYLKELEINLDNIINGKGDNVQLLNLSKLIADSLSNKNKSNAEKINLINQISFLSDEAKAKKLKLNELNAKLKQSEEMFVSFTRDIKRTQKDIDQLNNEKSNPQMIEVIQKQITKRESNIQQLEKKQNELLTRFASRVEVQFRDPEANFDRSKVKGRIIRLFTLNNEKYCKAIEQVAGGKLYNILVDNHTTAALLLSRKSFDYEVIMIPNNKITSKPIAQDKLKMIESVSNGEAILALDLISYDPEFKPAMQFVFGNTFICSTSEMAEKLAYSDNIRVKCVDLDGDIFDPTGLMTGGYDENENQESIVKKVVELSNIQKQLANDKKEIKQNKEELINITNNQRKLNELKNKLDSLTRDSQEYDKEKILDEMKEMENGIAKGSEVIKRNEGRIEELNEFEKKYQNELNKFKAEQDEFDKLGTGSKKNDAYQQKIKTVKNTIASFDKKITKIMKDADDIEFKISKLQNEIKENEEIIENETESLNTNKKDLEIIEKKIIEDTNQSKQFEADLYEKKKEITKNEHELNVLRENKDKLTSKKDSYVSDLKKLENKINKYEKEIKDSSERIKKAEEANKWIESECSFFGMKDTDYDFSNLNAKAEYEKVSKLKEDNASFKRKVNMKADVMADQYEKDYIELVKKKEIIIKDKQNIQNAIDELDKKRKEALEEIYVHVNKNLNSIYSSLLPGTKAKLHQIDSVNLMKGLELKVAFNNQWKNSLSELSGGQCSLLALSLILALLLYKPAPLYIFDEIDAALDLSHTANLGLMLKEHFPQSQFVVVSLKDGLFSNANVLYKVTYSEGTSKVERVIKSSI